MIILNQRIKTMKSADTDSFIIYIQTEDIYENIEDDIEKRFNTSNNKVNKPLLGNLEE